MAEVIDLERRSVEMLTDLAQGTVTVWLTPARALEVTRILSSVAFAHMGMGDAPDPQVLAGVTLQEAALAAAVVRAAEADEHARQPQGSPRTIHMVVADRLAAAIVACRDYPAVPPGADVETVVDVHGKGLVVLRLPASTAEDEG